MWLLIGFPSLFDTVEFVFYASSPYLNPAVQSHRAHINVQSVMPDMRIKMKYTSGRVNERMAFDNVT